MPPTFATVDEYIASFPEEIRRRLAIVRRLATGAVPGFGERISYGIPAVTLGGRDVVLYSAWKRHLAVYPVPHGDEALDRELAPFRAGKGTLQFRHDRPLPANLLRRVVTALAASASPAAAVDG